MKGRIPVRRSPASKFDSASLWPCRRHVICLLVLLLFLRFLREAFNSRYCANAGFQDCPVFHEPPQHPVESNNRYQTDTDAASAKSISPNNDRSDKQGNQDSSQHLKYETKPVLDAAL